MIPTPTFAPTPLRAELNSALDSSIRRSSLEHKPFPYQREYIPRGARIRFNVGGSIIESTADVLCRDGNSLLAKLCRHDAHHQVPRDRDGCFFFDRNPDLFRYVLAFLRDGHVPSSPELLRKLYIESAFFELRSLRDAIERRFTDTSYRREGGYPAPTHRFAYDREPYYHDWRPSWFHPRPHSHYGPRVSAYVTKPMPFSPAHPRSARCGDDSWRWELLRAATDALNESRSIRDRTPLPAAYGTPYARDVVDEEARRKWEELSEISRLNRKVDTSRLVSRLGPTLDERAAASRLPDPYGFTYGSIRGEYFTSEPYVKPRVYAVPETRLRVFVEQ